KVAEHITKSNKSMIQSLSTEGKTTDRNVDEGVQKLKDIFLDFTTKLQSPKFILPTHNTYDRDIVIANLKNSTEQLQELSRKVNLFETINHPVFGEVTKFEILYFVVYHTQRHIHQLKNIFQSVKEKQ